MNTNIHVRELLPTVLFRRWHVWHGLLHKSCTFDTNNGAAIERNVTRSRSSSCYFSTIRSSLVLSGLNAVTDGPKHVRLLSEELTALFPGQLIVE